MKTLISIAINDEEGDRGEKIGTAVWLKDAEVVTLKGRIAKYLRECAERRRDEHQAGLDRSRKGASACQLCNDSGEVRKKVFKGTRWVGTKGRMPCPLCIDRSADHGSAG